MLADLARMELMVTQILESARLERGRVELKAEAVQLAAAIARVIVQLEERARSGQVAISSEIAADLNVVSDPLALDVVVRNVLENAFAAVPRGGNITLTAQRANGAVALAVRDSGVGFGPADSARIFEKFTRLPGGGNRYGTGLGLFIVRRLMELSQGSVTAHSDGPGLGATITLTWPAAAASTVATSAAQAAVPEVQAPGATDMPENVTQRRASLRESRR